MCRKGEHDPKCENILMARDNKKLRLFVRLNPGLGGIFLNPFAMGLLKKN
jgi:hypothetical protein